MAVGSMGFRLKENLFPDGKKRYGRGQDAGRGPAGSRRRRGSVPAAIPSAEASLTLRKMPDAAPEQICRRRRRVTGLGASFIRRQAHW